MAVECAGVDRSDVCPLYIGALSIVNKKTDSEDESEVIYYKTECAMYCILMALLWWEFHGKLFPIKSEYNVYFIIKESKVPLFMVK